jgi:hypothetical protein
MAKTQPPAPTSPAPAASTAASTTVPASVAAPAPTPPTGGDAPSAAPTNGDELAAQLAADRKTDEAEVAARRKRYALEDLTHEEAVAGSLDRLEDQARAAGANDVQVGAIRRASSQFFAFVRSVLIDGNIEPAVGSAPAVVSDVEVARAREASKFDPPTAEERDEGAWHKVIDGFNGARVGARFRNKDHEKIAVKLLHAHNGNIPGDVAGFSVFEAHQLVATGRAELFDRTALKVIGAPRT